MKSRLLLAAAALGILSNSTARAGQIPVGSPDFTLTASSASGQDQLNPSLTVTPNLDGTYSVSASGQGTNLSLAFTGTLNLDPSITGSFTLVNLSNAPQTFTVSATLGGLLPLAGPLRVGGYFGDTTFSDAGPEDGQLEYSTTQFYRAEIDGALVKALGGFSGDVCGGPGCQVVISREAFGEPIPSQVHGGSLASTIAVVFPGFTLTSQDSVQVPFHFEVAVPEPASAAMLALACALVLRARRRSESL